MFKIIILNQVGADRYQKLIFEILLLSPLPLGELCTVLALHLLTNELDPLYDGKRTIEVLGLGLCT